MERLWDLVPWAILLAIIGVASAGWRLITAFVTDRMHVQLVPVLKSELESLKTETHDQTLAIRQMSEDITRALAMTERVHLLERRQDSIDLELNWIKRTINGVYRGHNPTSMGEGRK